MTKQTRATPEELLHFVETDEFIGDWQDLKLDIEIDLWELQIDLMAAPDAHPPISGTGGLRKARFSPSRWPRGKSGAVRVCYAYFPRHWIVLLVMAYGKGTQDTLTEQEKAGVRQYLTRIEAYLDMRKS